MRSSQKRVDNIRIGLAVRLTLEKGGRGLYYRPRRKETGLQIVRVRQSPARQRRNVSAIEGDTTVPGW